MDSHPPMELDRRFAPEQPNDQASTPADERLIELELLDDGSGHGPPGLHARRLRGRFAEAVRVEPFTMRTFSRLAEEIHPVVAVSSAWPLILAIALRRTRWPQLVPAAAATFLVLSIGGMFELWVQWGHARGYGGHGGLISLDEACVREPQTSDFALGTLGATQLLLELATAIRAILLIPGFRGAPGDADTKAERARQGACTGVWHCTHRSDTFSS